MLAQKYVFGSFLSSHPVIGDVGSVCGLQASRLPVCGWMLEAVKQAGDNPPAFIGAGYNLARCKMNGDFVRGRRSHFVWRDARSALAPSDEGAGFLRSKKTGGENDTNSRILSPSHLR